MPSMNMSVPHNLTADEAASRLRNFVRDMKAQYGNQVKNMSEKWENNKGTFSFEVMGMAISGILNVEAGQVRMEGQYPMAAMMFKSKIESAVREKITELLA